MGTIDGPHGSPPKVSIVLATFNERANLPVLLDGLRAQELPSFEVIIVDDGSTDGTREVLSAAARSDPRLRPVYHDGKQTTLRAQCQGISTAQGAYVVVMDADLQHPPSLVPAMVRELERGSALVVASRYAPGGAAGPRTISRWLISRGAEWAARLLLPPSRRVSDPVSGYFAFRREIWVPLDPLYRGYKLLLFVLVMAEGKRVTEVGFRFEPRASGTSKVTEGLGFVRIFVSELSLARRLRSLLRSRPASRVPVPETGAPAAGSDR